MKVHSFYPVCLLLALWIMGASSCTLKSEPVRATVAGKEHPAVLSPDPLEQLKRENERFCQGRSIHQHQDTTTIHRLVSGQHPQVVVIRCSDFRVLPEIVLIRDPEIFLLYVLPDLS